MEKYFRFKENDSSLRTEVIAGITTFLAAGYIIVVNPAIISNTGMPFNAVLTATVLVSAASSIAMGMYAHNPIVMAPGMGLNAFFTYTVVLGMGVRWETALGAVFWSGVIFILLSIFNVRTHVVRAIPPQLRFAIAGGIGLFISLIGFANAGFIVPDPATILGRGNLDAKTLTFLFGLAVTSLLVSAGFRGALISGIVLTTLAASALGRYWGNEQIVVWNGLISAPDFSLILALDFAGSLKLAMWPVIFSLLFTDLFDSISTFVGVAEAGDLKDSDGEPRNIKESLIVDGISTALSGLAGTSSGTSYIESAAGIKEGGRTGLTAVVAGILFLPFMFLSPLLSMVPAIATAPALVLVGVFMMQTVARIRWAEFDNAIPAFMAMFLIPVTYSITQGIIWGFLSWTLIKYMTGRRNEVPVSLLIIDFFAVLALIV